MLCSLVFCTKLEWIFPVFIGWKAFRLNAVNKQSTWKWKDPLMQSSAHSKQRAYSTWNNNQSHITRFIWSTRERNVCVCVKRSKNTGRKACDICRNRYIALPMIGGKKSRPLRVREETTFFRDLWSFHGMVWRCCVCLFIGIFDVEWFFFLHFGESCVCDFEQSGNRNFEREARNKQNLHPQDTWTKREGKKRLIIIDEIQLLFLASCEK